MQQTGRHLEVLGSRQCAVQQPSGLLSHVTYNWCKTYTHRKGKVARNRISLLHIPYLHDTNAPLTVRHRQFHSWELKKYFHADVKDMTLIGRMQLWQRKPLVLLAQLPAGLKTTVRKLKGSPNWSPLTFIIRGVTGHWLLLHSFTNATCESSKCPYLGPLDTFVDALHKNVALPCLHQSYMRLCDTQLSVMPFSSPRSWQTK